MRRFYAPADQFQDSRVTLNEEETRHLRDVLRMKPGDTAQIFDGEGGEFLARVTRVAKRETQLEVVEKVEPAAPESGLNLTLAVSVYKNDKLDLVVQKAVELGVVSLQPMISFRSEANLRDAVKRIERW